MADISKEINDFRTATYGRDVRESMISLAEKVNTEAEINTAHVDEAVVTANKASQTADQAAGDAQKAITEANMTLQDANAAKESAQASANAAAGSGSAAAESAAAASGSAADAAESAKEAGDIAAGLGGFDGAAASVKATDTQGIVVTTGEDSNAQELLDALAQKVVQELVTNDELTERLADYIVKSAIVQTESTSTETVPSSAYLKQALGIINSNLVIEEKVGSETILSLIQAMQSNTTCKYYINQKSDAPTFISSRALLTIEKYTTATYLTLEPSERNEVYRAFIWSSSGGLTSQSWVKSITNADIIFQGVTQAKLITYNSEMAIEFWAGSDTYRIAFGNTYIRFLKNGEIIFTK